MTSSMLSLIALVSFALLPAARAVDPPPDGGYPNENTAEGEDALFSLTTGRFNTAIGYNALYTNTTGEVNTAVGNDALTSNTSGGENTALGAGALANNTTGVGSVAVGAWSLILNTTGTANTVLGDSGMTWNATGSYNTALGTSALNFNNGNNNTATGYEALFGDSFQSDGNYNTANGFQTLHSISTGSYNTATGVQALYDDTTGISNTADGAYALFSNTTGFNNTANGVNALFYNTTGSENAANGNSALSLNTTGLNNTADGSQALLRNTTGNSNIALGFQAGQNLTIGSSNIDIGNPGVAGDSRKIRIGSSVHKNTYIAGIYGVTASRGLAVFIEPDGHLGTATSSARFKDKIKPMDRASEAILSLEPVTFRYKEELDPDGVPQFGLVAEDVAKVNPDLVARDDDGKPYTVRYEAVNAMLLNEFLKEHRRNEAQQKQIDTVTQIVKEQAAQIQKVSAQLAADKAAPHLVASE